MQQQVYAPPQIPSRDKFRVYIIPREDHNDSFNSFPTLYRRPQVIHNHLYLYDNTTYSLGIQSSSHLPAEAMVHIDGRYMGVIHLRPHRTFELKRNTIDK